MLPLRRFELSDHISRVPYSVQTSTRRLTAADNALAQDRGDTPQDPVYEKVLKGLNLVARHAAMPLLDALLAWRKDAESQASRSAPESVVIRKKVMRSSVHVMT